MSELKYRAISLHQPWATAMALGHKKNETRNRLTHVRGDVVICAARRKLVIHEWRVMKGLLHPDYDYPLGVALCVVEIYQCDAAETVEETALERSLGDYCEGRYAWRTRNLRRLREPVPVTGKQGFFFITGAEAEAIRKQIV